MPSMYLKSAFFSYFKLPKQKLIAYCGFVSKPDCANIYKLCCMVDSNNAGVNRTKPLVEDVPLTFFVFSCFRFKIETSIFLHFLISNQFKTCSWDLPPFCIRKSMFPTVLPSISSCIEIKDLLNK